jgi:hypothetical protein
LIKWIRKTIEVVCVDASNPSKPTRTKWKINYSLMAKVIVAKYPMNN